MTANTSNGNGSNDSDGHRAPIGSQLAVPAPLDVDLPRSVAAPGIARRALRSWMVALACADELVEDAALVVSETVTNAVVHARSAPRLRVNIVDDRLRLEVHDTSPELPVLRAASAVADGQGLRIVIAVGWRPVKWCR